MLALTEKPTTKRQTLATRKQQRSHDLPLLLVLLLTSLVSIGATIFYMQRGETLLYDDAYSHLEIARRVIDSLTPGITQFGGVWLPFQHMLIEPFIWNDFLWQSGLAGSIPSMCCYVVASGYLFCLIRRLTHNVSVGIIGVFVFASNPNILYLQATPLTEVICTATFVAVAYYLLCWFEEGKRRFLIFAALATIAATLTRYDGWALFLMASAVALIIGIRFKASQADIMDQVLFFLTIASLGIIAWIIWNKALFADPLYFFRGPYSSGAHQLSFLRAGQLPTYHQPLVSIQVYTATVIENLGWALFGMALAGFIVALLAYRKRAEVLLFLVMVTPFCFYIASLYLGQSIIDLPGVDSTNFFNVRYGAQMVLPAAFFVALGADQARQVLRPWSFHLLVLPACLLLVLWQVVMISISGPITLADGLNGLSCINPSTPVIRSLAQHYQGGNILVYEFTSDINPQLFGADFRNVIYEGSDPYWTEALAHPTQFADWVILNPYNSNDVVAHLYTKHRQQFLSQFTLIASNDDGLQLYYRKGAPSLPTRPLPGQLVNRPRTCTFKG